MVTPQVEIKIREGHVPGLPADLVLIAEAADRPLCLRYDVVGGVMRQPPPRGITREEAEHRARELMCELLMFERLGLWRVIRYPRGETELAPI